MMNTGPGVSTKRRFRRWPRRILVTANLGVAVLLIGGGVIYGAVKSEIGSIKTGSGQGLSKSNVTKDVSSGLRPENILLIGNETRAGQVDVNFGNAAVLTGTLSDVIMILHLDPATKKASLLSIPRDLFVPMPAGSLVGPWQKIDAALNDGKLGPNNLATAIQDDLGIPINHYVEVDFDGFLQTVNALGGIKLNFPERLYDQYSGLNITHTGCQLLDGQQALAMVRARHLQYDPPGVSPSDVADWPFDPESDLARIVRDHTFVRVLALTAKSEGLTDPLKAISFINATLNQLTIDPRLKGQLLHLISHYGDINPTAVPAETVPVTQILGPGDQGYYYAGYQIGDTEFTDEPADMNAIRAWDPEAFPAPVTPSSVSVYSLDGVASSASDVASSLHLLGFNASVGAPQAPPASQVQTLVQYHPGQLAQGMAVIEKLRGAVVLQADAAVPAGQVEVAVGTTLAVDQPAGTTTTAPVTTPTPGGQTPSPSTDQSTPYDPLPC